MNQHLTAPAWWEGFVEERISLDEISNIIREYRVLIKIGLIHALFATLESTFRIYVQAFYPDNLSLATGSFHSIYRKLLEEHFTRKPAESCELLDLLRLVRNTIHNNGVYFYRQGSDHSVTYRGVTYRFRHNQPIDFFSDDLLLSLIDDVNTLLFEVVLDPLLLANTDLLRDPFDMKL